MNTQLIINQLLAILIQTEPYYAWYRYIYHTYQWDYTRFANLEAQLASKKKCLPIYITVYINTDDETLEFRVTEEPNPEVLEADPITHIINGFTFYILFD